MLRAVTQCVFTLPVGHRAPGSVRDMARTTNTRQRGDARPAGRERRDGRDSCGGCLAPAETVRSAQTLALDPAESLSTTAFTTLFRGHPGGVAVITADAGDGPAAMTATSVASVSVEPPILLFSVSALSSASSVLSRARSVVVHLLDAQDIELARLCATSGVDRFADASLWTRLATGEPVYRRVRAWVRCTVIGTLRAGTGTVVTAQAVQSHIERDPTHDASALAYWNRTWHRLDADSRIT